MKKTALLIAFCCLSAFIEAQEKPWTLAQCVDYAIAHNLTVKQREMQRKQQEISLSTARNSRLPDINGSINESFSFGRGLTSQNTYVSRNTQSTGLSLNTSIPLFTGFRIPNQIALCRINLQAAAEELQRAKEAISVQVASAYLQVLLSRDMWQVAAEQTHLSEIQQQRLERFLKEGKVAENEVSEARSRTAQDKLSETQSKNAYRLALLDLTQLLELASPEGFEVADPEKAEPRVPGESPEEIYRIAMEIKPEIRTERLRLAGTEKSIRLAKAGYFPQISFGAGLGSNYYKTSGYEANSFGRQLKDNFSKSIGLNMSIPLFNRFSTRNAVREARLQRENQLLALDQAGKTLYKEIQQAYYNAVAAEEKYRSSQAAAKAAEESFRLMQKKFEQGQAIATEYEEAKTRRFKAMADQLQALYDGLLRIKILAFYKGEPIR